jgi:hypothetical protein
MEEQTRAAPFLPSPAHATFLEKGSRMHALSLGCLLGQCCGLCHEIDSGCLLHPPPKGVQIKLVP